MAAASPSDADLLIYGCDVGAGVAGQDLLSAISQLTGADLAASDDLTGAGLLGGDWDLEIQTGIIETSSVVTSSGQQQWLHLLDLVPTAQFQVNSTTSNQQSTESESPGQPERGRDGQLRQLRRDLEQ